MSATHPCPSRLEPGVFTLFIQPGGEKNILEEELWFLFQRPTTFLV
jgi:hypothetical protein